MNVSVVENLAKEHPEIVEQGRQQLDAVLEKAATDMDFRQQLVTYPRETLSAYTGENIPETMNIVFIENHADATIVLPPYHDASGEFTDGELLEEELEAVAGGEAVVSSTLGIIASVLTIAATIGYIVND